MKEKTQKEQIRIRISKPKYGYKTDTLDTF